MEKVMLQKLKEIVQANPDLRERQESWSISYNKDADMILMGGKFPERTFYYPLEDTGFLVRIDKENRIHGFAIENAKDFIKENPETGFALSFLVYPTRSLVSFFLTYQAAKGIRKVKEIGSLVSASSFVANRAAFCN